MASASDQTPALKPPPGVDSNFDDPKSLFKWNVLCVVLSLCITTPVVFLRTYVRLYIKREWILEDWICSLAWAGLVTFCALMTMTMSRHGGVHEWDLTRAEVHEALYWFNATSIEYAPTILFAKLAVLMLFRRVFVPVSKKKSWFDWAIRILIAILIGFYLSTTIVKIWECNPREKIWNKTTPGQCVNLAVLLNMSGLFNTITDFIILLIPVKAVWALKMSKKKKWAVVLIFTVGLTAPVFSLIGFIVRLKISSNPDTTWNQPEILLWATAEVSSGLVCVCIPTLGPLSRKRRNEQHNLSNAVSISTSQRKYLSMRDQKASTMDEEDLLGLRATANGSPGSIVLPAVAVTTGIRGGANTRSSVDRDVEMHNFGIIGNHGELQRPNAILTTVKMEQTYV